MTIRVRWIDVLQAEVVLVPMDRISVKSSWETLSQGDRPPNLIPSMMLLLHAGYHPPRLKESLQKTRLPVCPSRAKTAMVSITVSLKGKAPIKLDFAGKQANDVTIKEVKTAVQAKFPKVRLSTLHSVVRDAVYSEPSLTRRSS